MSKPVLIDLFCGAGGATKGYQHAGFYVIGVDINPQPRYCGDEFYQQDALDFDLGLADAVHASPPCHRYSSVTQRGGAVDRTEYPDLVAPVRSRLEGSGRPWVIENVIGAPLRGPIRLCGSAFGLDLRRHRLFESNVPLLGAPCSHGWQRPRFRSLDSGQKTLATVVGVHGHLNYPGELELRRSAMGIDWMTNAELTQAIPPAYAEYVGRQLLAAL